MLYFKLSSVLVLLYLINFNATAALTEIQLMELARAQSPTWLRLQAQASAQQLPAQLIKEGLSAQAFAESQYTKSQERPLNPFAPVVEESIAWQAGIRKNFLHGIGINTRVFSEQVSNTFFQEGTTVGAALGLELDLYRNFLGSLTKAQLHRAQFGQLAAQWEERIGQYQFLMNLRKIYWSLVAIEESLKISQQLLVTSEQQLQEAKKRQRNNIADAGEVARYQSQVAARKASIQSFQYQKALLWQQLKSALPELAASGDQLAPYHLDQTLNQVLGCAEVIQQQAAVPLTITYYDDYLTFLEQQYQQTQKITQKHDSFDLKLLAETRALGKDFGHSEAFDEFKSDATPVYQVGLQFNLPLGSAPKQTEQTQQLVEKLQYEAARKDILAKLSAYHQQTQKMVTILMQVIANQKLNSESLNLSLKVAKQKFNQARISLRELLNDQDAYLSSSLQEIDTKLKTIHTFMDYFSVYQKVPCQLNQLTLK